MVVQYIGFVEKMQQMMKNINTRNNPTTKCCG